MSYRKQLKAWFGHLPLEVDDLLLLERFELLALPQRAPLRPLGVVLAADHRLRRFIEVRCPELATWLGEIVEDAAGDTGDLAEHQRAVVWELADWLVYQRFPEAYDGVDALRWDASQLGDVCEIEGRTVVDAGAGTGWLSEALAHRAKAVFAVEPVGRLREHIRRRAAAAGQDNLYAVDGFLHRIPLPAGYADVLVTSRAIGWRLEDELTEVERVVAPDGWVVHFLGGPVDAPGSPLDDALESRGYASSRYRDGGGWKRRYAKQIGR